MTKKSAAALLSLATAASLLAGLGALSAQAAAIGIGASTSVSASASTDKSAKIVAQGDKDIDARVEALNKLSDRINAMKNVSAAEKASITANVQDNVTGLTALKAKIDAETDLTALATDTKSIFGSFRIYALVVPQGFIIAAADRIITISGMMDVISAKIQGRLTLAQNAGKDVKSLQTSLAVLNAKVADAKLQAQAANTSVAALVPDKNDPAVIKSNHDALVAGRADTKKGSDDLKAADSDLKSIVKALAGLHISAGASATSSATTTVVVPQ